MNGDDSDVCVPSLFFWLGMRDSSHCGLRPAQTLQEPPDRYAHLAEIKVCRWVMLIIYTTSKTCAAWNTVESTKVEHQRTRKIVSLIHRAKVQSKTSTLNPKQVFQLSILSYLSGFHSSKFYCTEWHGNKINRLWQWKPGCPLTSCLANCFPLLL